MARRDAFARKYDPSTLSPRVRTAIRLYGSGAVKSMCEASKAVGLYKNVLYVTRWKDPRMDIYLAQIDRQIEEGTVDMSKVLVRLGRQAVVNIAHLAEAAQKEDVRLRANQDLADRSPETQKTHKLRLEEDIRMTPESIEALRAALAESARAREEFAEVVAGDYITVDEESSARHLAMLPSKTSVEGNGTGHSDS